LDQSQRSQISFGILFDPDVVYFKEEETILKNKPAWKQAISVGNKACFIFADKSDQHPLMISSENGREKIIVTKWDAISPINDAVFSIPEGFETINYIEKGKERAIKLKIKMAEEKEFNRIMGEVSRRPDGKDAVDKILSKMRDGKSGRDALREYEEEKQLKNASGQGEK